MKFLLLTLFVALAYSAPVDENVDAVELIVKGLPEDAPLEIGDILAVKLKENIDGEVVASKDILFPHTAAGLAEAAAAEEAEMEVVPVMPELPETGPIVLPELIPGLPETGPIILPEIVAPEIPGAGPIILPEIVAPEIPGAGPIILPEIVAPEIPGAGPIILPEIVAPEVPEAGPIILPEIVAPELIPETVQEVPNGEIFNDGVLQVTVHTPEDAGVIASLQSWFSMVLNYFNGAQETTHQIV